MENNYEPPKPFELQDVKVTYYQERDDQSDIHLDNMIDIEMCGINYEMGYFVIKTQRWAFDDIDEMVELLKDFKIRTLLNQKTDDETNNNA